MPNMEYGDWISIAFVAVIVLGCVLMCVLKKQVSFICNFASALGVLGTFVGIFIGLLDFDVADIQSSIPPLLEGLKTAFVTSIVGMVCALLVKLFYRERKEVAPLVVEDAKNTMYLSEILRSTDDLREMLVEQLACVAGVLNEINKTQENCTQLLDGRIQEFGKIVAEQSSKELIGAIQKVMEDFNAKINDQLGQSFKDLTESCKNLNRWQQEHVELLKVMDVYNSKIAGYLMETDGFLVRFDEQQKVYVQNSKMLRDEIVHLGRFITRVSEVGGNFERAVPLMETKMDGVIQDFTNIVNMYSVQTKSILDAQTKMNGEMNRAMQTFSEHLEGVLRNFHNKIVAVENNLLR